MSRSTAGWDRSVAVEPSLAGSSVIMMRKESKGDDQTRYTPATHATALLTVDGLVPSALSMLISALLFLVCLTLISLALSSWAGFLPSYSYACFIVINPLSFPPPASCSLLSLLPLLPLLPSSRLVIFQSRSPLLERALARGARCPTPSPLAPAPAPDPPDPPWTCCPAFFLTFLLPPRQGRFFLALLSLRHFPASLSSAHPRTTLPPSLPSPRHPASRPHI